MHGLGPPLEQRRAEVDVVDVQDALADLQVDALDSRAPRGRAR